ncbi:hypothetical protein QAD02_006332 [Eretmocerus hayati]|uniref:Uncharacterized protein n=1 Tax=Eretmocerus hayati TaxID=131215 RepID=A0ACC2N0K1_9HYME|nr:hypothetical protein QAD02_006332 [Eretmocerus hayati]
MDWFTSLYDLMFKNPNSLAKYAQNENFLKVIETIRSRRGYPLFGDMIKRQYDRGCRRLLVLEPAKVALNVVTGVNWPYCCCEAILSNLSDENLRDLIKCTSIGGRTNQQSLGNPSRSCVITEPPSKMSRIQE